MFKHSGGLLCVDTPLGDDTLHLEAFDGAESFSRPFEYRLDLLSSKEAIDAKSIVGKGMAFQVIGEDGALATWHGVVRQFVGGGLHPSGLRVYQAILVPWTLFLTKRSTCRIFQNMKVDEIVSQVFKEAGYSDFSIKLQRTYPSLEYRVQFRETDFEFVSRLLDEEGIFYFFKHEQKRHVLVIGDSANSYSPCSQKSVQYAEGSLKAYAVSSWVHGYNYVSGRWSGTDYNFTKPAANPSSEISTVLELSGAAAMERFEYPGRYVDRTHGDAKTKAWIEAEEASYEVVNGASERHSFRVARTFKVQSHSFPSEEGKEYAITAVPPDFEESNEGPGVINQHGVRLAASRPAPSGDWSLTGEVLVGPMVSASPWSALVELLATNGAVLRLDLLYYAKDRNGAGDPIVESTIYWAGQDLANPREGATLISTGEAVIMDFYEVKARSKFTVTQLGDSIEVEMDRHEKFVLTPPGGALTFAAVRLVCDSGKAHWRELMFTRSE